MQTGSSNGRASLSFSSEAVSSSFAAASSVAVQERKRTVFFSPAIHRNNHLFAREYKYFRELIEPAIFVKGVAR